MKITILIIVFSGAFIALLGYLIKEKKMYWLISGYNTAKKEQKERYDIEGLADFLAKQLYFMAGIFLAASLTIYFKLEVLSGLVFFLILPQSMYMVIKAQSFYNAKEEEAGKLKRQTIFLGIFLGAATIFIAGLLYLSYIPALIDLEEEYIDIKGLYGRKIYYSEIDTVTLEESIPKIVRRTNGSSIGDIRKGRFSLENRENVLLFLEKEGPDYLIIEYSRGKVIINNKDNLKTIKLFQDIEKARE
jgi:hypothetical protein